MKCLAYDVQPHPDAQAMGVEFVDLETLLQNSDFVTIHAALTDANQGMMGEAELKQMKPTALLVNTARGGHVQESALMEALKWSDCRSGT